MTDEVTALHAEAQRRDVAITSHYAPGCEWQVPRHPSDIADDLLAKLPDQPFVDLWWNCDRWEWQYRVGEETADKEGNGTRIACIIALSRRLP